MDMTSSAGGVLQFSPVEITAMILAQLKEDAEKYVGESVKFAVLTLPVR